MVRYPRSRVEGSNLPDMVVSAGPDASGVLEARLASAGFRYVAGADEVEGELWPVPSWRPRTILPPDAEIQGLRISVGTRLQRERLAEQIRDVAIATCIVRVRPEWIDRDGLQRCNLQALRRALKGLGVRPDYSCSTPSG